MVEKGAEAGDNLKVAGHAGGRRIPCRCRPVEENYKKVRFVLDLEPNILLHLAGDGGW
jgi:hypothetical protein